MRLRYTLACTIIMHSQSALVKVLLQSTAPVHGAQRCHKQWQARSNSGSTQALQQAAERCSVAQGLYILVHTVCVCETEHAAAAAAAASSAVVRSLNTAAPPSG
jgi:hypothetical protein